MTEDSFEAVHGRIRQRQRQRQRLVKQKQDFRNQYPAVTVWFSAQGKIGMYLPTNKYV